MNINAFITHKKAERFMDCQDRFSVNIDTKSVAVSDGMGSTWQQKIWARLLVEAFTNDSQWYPNTESICSLSQMWQKEVQSFIEDLQKKLDSPNYPETEKKLIEAQIYRNQRNLGNHKSAGATLVGLRFVDDNKCKAVVLGDSCLIVWDGSNAEFLTSQEGQEFDSYPDYFDSDPLKKGKGVLKEKEYIVKNNTYLLLVSDPFSEFLWKKNKKEKIKECIDALINLKSHEDFETLVSEWREQGMSNDDTTAIVISPNQSNNIQQGIVDNIEDFINFEKEEPPKKEITSTLQQSNISNTKNDSKLTEISHEELSKIIYTRCNETWSSNECHNIFKQIIRYIVQTFKKTNNKCAKNIFEEITINCIKEVLKDYQIFKKT